MRPMHVSPTEGLARPGEPADPAAVTAWLRGVLRGDEWIPPRLSQVALDVYAMVEDPAATTEGLARAIATDATLADQLLRAANSPAFRRGAPARSVDVAVTRLGMRCARNLVIQRALSESVFRSPVYQHELTAVFQHSVATAHVARLLASRAGVDGSEAFLGGLLHDVGLAGALHALVLHDGSPRLRAGEVWSSIVECEREAGERTARSWGLPGVLVRCVTCHHDPGPDVEPLVLVVSLADHFASLMGRIIQVPGVRASQVDRTEARVVVAVAERLGVPRDELRRIYAEAGRLPALAR